MTIKAKAFAKLNLCLRILGKRPDGYHDIETVMQSISLFDEVTVEGSDQISVSFRWAPGLSGDLPSPPDLCHKAARLFFAATGLAGGASIDVVKRIPIGAGLAGGSADAAATLVALDAIYGTSLDAAALAELGAQVGSDVAFCIGGGCAVGRGRGDELESIAASRQLWWVIGIPSRPISTSAAYGTYDMIWQAPTDPCDELAEALRKGAVAQVASLLSNDLEEPAFQIDPGLEQLKTAMEIAGAMQAVMTGSGSAIAGLCMNEQHAREVNRSALFSFPRVEVVSSVASGIELI